MNLTTETSKDITIVRIGENRLVYPLLSDFLDTVTKIIETGKRKILIDLSQVNYVDSATMGCFMDLYRQIRNVDGVLKLSGVKNRVETMFSMTGAQNFIELHSNEASALKSFKV
tara:strand:+ start:560 stop:901 length:342 start_codon:yes stop_codon:yes gene_type:complete